jgi:integrase
MPAARPHVPKYCLHKARGLAYVRNHGKVCYLGKHGSPESKEAYTRFLIGWEASQAGAPPLPDPGVDLTVVELCAAYWDFAQRYYTKNGMPSGWLTHIRLMLRKVRETYGHTPASEFGPRKLKAIRQSLIGAGHSRVYINKLVPIVLRMFKWATAEELLPGNVYQALRSVEGLKKGRTAAHETKPVLPAPDEVVDATLPYLPPVVADMVRFERLTGCRPGEVCMVRPCDVERSGEVWQYRPESHKTEHHGRQRIIYIGPQAQAVLLSYLLRDAHAHCFQPVESERKRREAMRSRRRTRIQPSQQNRRKARPARAPKTAYDRNSYARAVKRAVEKANADRRKAAAQAGDDSPVLLSHWHPNQLRHSAATKVRKMFNLEAAQVMLGHAKADVTQVYAERDARLAVEVAKKIG